MADEHLIRLTELTIRLSDGHKAEVVSVWCRRPC
jgi:hypothetical protein